MARLIAAVAVVVASTALAQTQVGGPVDPQRAERCAVRVGIALTGKSPSAAVLSSGNPQLEVGALLESEAFIERFARFINTTFNDTPGTASADDGAYHLTRHILVNDKPWKDLFIGAYDVALVSGQVVVRDDPNGLGFCRPTAVKSAPGVCTAAMSLRPRVLLRIR